MPSSCSVFWCNSDKRKNAGSGIRYFGFPRNRELQQEWIRACDRPDDINVADVVVCSKHFKEVDYQMKYQLFGKDNTKYHRLLKKDAVPSLLLSPDADDDANDEGLLHNASFLSSMSGRVSVASTSSRPSRECEEDTDVSSLSSMCGKVSDASTEAFPDRESEVDRQQQDLLHDVSSLSSTSGRGSGTASVGTSFCESELAKELYITANSFKDMDLGLDPPSELYDEEEGEREKTASSRAGPTRTAHLTHWADRYKLSLGDSRQSETDVGRL
ncbi:hypothetical protein Pcinc_005206 [Petrolisthes cinctipes]|uniref:THAP-type domain-containing protein n=1 Tax=Petrolisthes cinctipes TaxID=88211 RepID=A0AAE1GE50_PETCI|nr:hypothetical protein Pcinc_005206 [Petrolisthes cinctipes]